MKYTYKLVGVAPFDTDILEFFAIDIFASQQAFAVFIQAFGKAESELYTSGRTCHGNRRHKNVQQRHLSDEHNANWFNYIQRFKVYARPL